MAKWYNIVKGNRDVSQNNKRFLSSRDMMEAKRMESIVNSEYKRGQRKKKHSQMSMCSCGCEGCWMIY